MVVASVLVRRLVVLAPLALGPILLFPRLEWMWVALVAPFVCVVSWRTRGHWLPQTPLSALLMVLLVMVLISLWATPDIHLSLGKVSGVLLGVCIFFAVVEFADTRAGLRTAMAAFVVMGGVLSVLFALGTRWKAPQWFLGTVLFDLLPMRVTGIAGAEAGFNANPVGGTAILFIPLAAIMTWSVWRDWAAGSGRSQRRALTGLVLLGVTVALLGILIVGQSVAAWAGLGAVALAASAVRFRWASVGVALGLLALAALALCLPQVAGAPTDPSGFLGSRLVSLEIRAEIWVRALYGLRDFPLTGMGMDVFRAAVPVVYPLFSISPDADIANAHNQWLQTALDLGLPGMVVLVGIWVATAVILFRVWRESTVRLHRLCSVGIGAGLFAQFVAQMVDAIPLGAKAGVFWWGALGLAAALYRLECVDAGRPKRALAGTWLVWAMASCLAVACVRADVRLALFVAGAGGAALGWYVVDGRALSGWTTRARVGAAAVLCLAALPLVLLSWMLNRGYVHYTRGVLGDGGAVESGTTALRVLALDGTNARAHLLLALSQRAEGRHAEALETFVSALEQEPANSIVQYRVGEAFDQMGDQRQAVDHWRKASAGAHLWRLGRSALDRRNVLSAKHYFERATLVTPDGYDAWLGLGDTYVALGDVTGANAAYDVAINLEPTRIDAYDALVRLLQSRRDLDGAEEILRRAVESVTSPLGGLFYLRSRVAAERGDFAAAEDYAQQAIADRPQNGSRLAWLGDLYYQQKKYPLAARQYAHAAATTNNPTWVWRSRQRLGRVYAAQHLWDAAIAEHSAATEESNAQQEAASIVAQNYVELGRVFVAAHQLDKAESAFRQALTHDRENAAAVAELAALLRRTPTAA